MAVIQTIGHSTRSLADFVDLLRAHKITAIADVRSQPYSRTNPQFNRELLIDCLSRLRIAYVFLGRELGARTTDQSCYADGKVQYERLASTPAFQHGLDRIQRGSEKFQLALLCAERDPLLCHRSILIGRHLVNRGETVNHIIDGCESEDHVVSMQRLLASLRIDIHMFKTKEELLTIAYEKQGARIAYKRESLTSGEGSYQA